MKEFCKTSIISQLKSDNRYSNLFYVASQPRLIILSLAQTDRIYLMVFLHVLLPSSVCVTCVSFMSVH